MYAHPITRDLSEWWTKYGSRHESPEWQSYLKHYASCLNRKIDELASAHDNQGLFGMSGVGGCTRKSVLKALGHKGEPYTGDTLLTWHIGHNIENIALATMLAMGYSIETQAEVRYKDLMLSWSDGVIRSSIREDIPKDAILSVKSTGYKMSGKTKDGFKRYGFAALALDGIRKAQSSWWAQAQAEMLGSGSGNALVVVVAKDVVQVFRDDPIMQEVGSISFFAQLIQRDDKFCSQLDEAWSEAMRSVKSESIPAPLYYSGSSQEYVELPSPGDVANGWKGPNQDATGTFNPCFGCEMSALCRQRGE